LSIDPKYAVILAAGSGTRLRPLTNNTPKCLVKVCNQPILYYQIKSLLANNIKKILIVIGYKGDMIRNFISSEFDNKDVQFTYIKNNIYEKTGSCYSLLLCQKYLQGKDYIHINSDLVFGSKLLKLVLAQKKKDLIITSKPDKINEDMVRFECDNDRLIKKVGRPESVKLPNGYLVGPVYCSDETKELCLNLIGKRINEGFMTDTCFLLLDKLITSISLKAVDCGEEKWFEIDTINDLEEANKNFNTSRGKEVYY